MARRNHTDGLFAKLSQRMLRCTAYRGLSPFGKNAVIELEMNYWESNRANPIELPERWLAEVLGCNPKTARRVITELDDWGFIAMERRGKLKGPLKSRAAVYRLTWQPDNEGSPATNDYRGYQEIKSKSDARKNGALTRQNGNIRAPKSNAARSNFRSVGESLPELLEKLRSQQDWAESER